MISQDHSGTRGVQSLPHSRAAHPGCGGFSPIKRRYIKNRHVGFNDEFDVLLTQPKAETIRWVVVPSSTPSQSVVATSRTVNR